jgi:hypothetical protein
MAPSSSMTKIRFINKLIYTGFPHPQTEKEFLYTICRSDPDTNAVESRFADVRNEIRTLDGDGEINLNLISPPEAMPCRPNGRGARRLGRQKCNIDLGGNACRAHYAIPALAKKMRG